jgi:AbrB family looped-hinge helix DNA binding protein
MASVKVSRKNQIAVPAAARRRLGIRPGDRLEVEVGDDAIVLRPRPTGVADELRDLAPELWQGIDAATYLRDLRDEWSRREH